MLRKDVPAVLASIPLSVNTPNIALVSSSDAPANLAMGATVAIAVPNFSKSNALPLNDAAITSATLPDSDACRSKPFIVAAATVADCAKSSPVARAKSRIAAVDASISSGLNPNFDKLSCNSATCAEVYRVVRPKSSAFFSSILNCSPVAPEIAFTLAIDCSKSIANLTDAPPINASGNVNERVIDVPIDFIFFPVLRICR